MKQVIRFKFTKILLDWQKKVNEACDNYRFIVISAGRQSGKTFFCVLKILSYALHENNKNSICWWVAPTYDLSKIAFRRAIKLLADNKIVFDRNLSELKISFHNGSEMYFKSADKEDSLRGETVDFMVIDEMGVVKRDVWSYALRGTITATEAQVIFIGTPKGKNLFHELFVLGQDKKNDEYISFQFSSNESKYFSIKEWENVKKLPERIFRQEYCAEFLDDGGEVFRNIRECIKGKLEKPGRKNYYAGVDLAKSMDYTVICILDQNGHLCAFDRFNDISWNIQKERIINLCDEYNAQVLIDSTGVGDPILDDLNQRIKAHGYKFTNISKRQLIESFSIAIEKLEVSFPDIPELINELNIFTFSQTSSGTIRYNAPDGLHDDIVIALALAYRCLNKKTIPIPKTNQLTENRKSKALHLPE